MKLIKLSETVIEIHGIINSSCVEGYNAVTFEFVIVCVGWVLSSGALESVQCCLNSSVIVLKMNSSSCRPRDLGRKQQSGLSGASKMKAKEDKSRREEEVIAKSRKLTTFFGVEDQGTSNSTADSTDNDHRDLGRDVGPSSSCIISTSTPHPSQGPLHTDSDCDIAVQARKS